MSKIQLLSQCLVEKFGMTQKESDEFVAALFGVIREKILSEKLVKVKGLGTFKLAEMNARESVDVNTGERITIEGKYKLSFTPENAVRDRINAPFAQFESFDMDEDVDFSAVDKKYETSETETPEEPVTPAEQSKPEDTATQESPVAVEAPAVSVAPAVADVPEVTETPKEPEPEPLVSPAPVAQPEPTPVVVPEPVTQQEPESPVEPDNTVEPVAEPTPQPAPVAEPQPNAPVATETTDEEPKHNPYCEEMLKTELDRSKRILRIVLVIVVLLVIALLAIGGYFLYQMGKNSATQNNIEQVEQQKPTPVVKDSTEAKADTTSQKAEKDTLKLTAQQKDDESKAEQQNTDVTKTEQTNDPDAVDPALYNNKDARVRHGAYDIVGVKMVVTAKKGDTLAGISHRYLGPDTECYTEALNYDITMLKAGDKVKIPKLELKPRLKNRKRK